MTFLDSEGFRMHYAISGDRSLPALVFSNSLGANLAMWEPQVQAVQALDSGYRLLRYDSRGHGQSAANEGDFSIADLGRDVLRLLDALEIERASFCGLSMGGMVGQWLGIHAPDRLRKLVLANTAAKIGVAEVWNARIELVRREGLDPVIPGTLERWFTPGFHADQPETIVAIAAMLKATDVAAYAASCAALRDADFRGAIHAISAPTLVIAGDSDPVTPPSDGRFLAEKIHGASYVELSAAHLSNVEAATAFNAALIEFLRD